MKPIRRFAILIGVLALGGVSYLLWAGPSPHQMTRRFIEAVEQRDPQKMYDLTLIEQRERMKLTPEKVRVLMNHTLWSFPTIKAEATQENTTRRKKNWSPDLVHWTVFWTDGEGQHLPVKGTMGKGRMWTQIHSRRSQGRWGINFALFFVRVCRSKWGADLYVPVCKKFGVRPVHPHDSSKLLGE